MSPNPQIMHSASALEMADIQCVECGVVFSIPLQLRDHLREAKKTFYCPSGHGNVYKESEAGKYKRLLEEEQKRRQQEFCARNEAEEKLRKLERRVRNGVCPHCRRSFTDLRRHMETKHKKQ